MTFLFTNALYNKLFQISDLIFCEVHVALLVVAIAQNGDVVDVHREFARGMRQTNGRVWL